MNFFRRAGAEIARLLASAADPAAEPGRALIYAKDVSGAVQVFARSSSGVISQLTPIDGAFLEYAEWRTNGTLTVLASTDTAWMGRAGVAYTVVGVIVYRNTAGSGGQTRINLMLGANGGTAAAMYSAGARPTITAASGNFRHLYAAVPDLTAVVPANGRLEVNIEEVETGTPVDLSVRVVLSPT